MTVHLITVQEVGARAEQILIGNNLGKVNGWVPSSAVIGKVIAPGEAASE